MLWPKLVFWMWRNISRVLAKRLFSLGREISESCMVGTMANYTQWPKAKSCNFWLGTFSRPASLNQPPSLVLRVELMQELRSVPFNVLTPKSTRTIYHMLIVSDSRINPKFTINQHSRKCNARTEKAHLSPAELYSHFKTCWKNLILMLFLTKKCYESSELLN